MPRRLRMLAVVALLAGCGEEVVAGTEQIELLIEDEGCTPDDYGALYSLSITVYGQQGPNVNDLCLDAPRCLFVDELESLADVVGVLQDEPQPLVEADAQGAVRIAIHGHERGCFSYGDPGDAPPVMCGFADLGSASDGGIEVRLGCSDCEPPPLALCE